ncbi:hypothetical protein ACIOEZ_20570 [Streptomyces sp. NPDC087866]|uniref:hypothetical protein n=1 Tax=unclassified Streptomyces TaxID=2593676 RepID=UPI00224D0824|nr:hypothetical protein [Streptomyces sp. NBC_01789]MCX4447972.1 hypothetical protein [Streptomyces sp. NBC_01789]
MGVRGATGTVLVTAAVLATAGCGDDTGKSRTAAATESARAYQQAQLDQDWETACEAITDRLRRSWGAGTIDECVDIRDIPRISDTSNMRVTTGRPVDLPAYGSHPAGIGLRVSFGPDGNGTYRNTAQRLVPGDGTWLVDQSVNLTDGTDTEAVREALTRK